MNDLQKRIEKWVEKMMPLIGIARYEDEHGDKEASEAIMAAYGYAEELRKEIKRLAKVESLKAAEIERLKGGIASVKKLHTRYGLYHECEHDCYKTSRSTTPESRPFISKTSATHAPSRSGCATTVTRTVASQTRSASTGSIRVKRWRRLPYVLKR